MSINIREATGLYYIFTHLTRTKMLIKHIISNARSVARTEVEIARTVSKEEIILLYSV